MNDPITLIRGDLLQIVGAIGAIREQAVRFDVRDSEYLEKELTAMQSAAHRLFEFLDNVAERN